MIIFASIWKRIKKNPLSKLGPGLITGVADDDPSGIVTYSQAGAQFGLNMLWTMPLTYPLMAAVQLMCALIGRVTGRGLAANIKSNFPPYVLLSVVVLLFSANTLNIAADLSAMGEVAELVSGVDRHVMTAGFVFLSLGLQIFIPYHRYVFFLKWLTLSLLAYAAVLFTIHVPWGEVGLRTFIPQLTLNADTASVIVAIFGTTISPYLFFWQASEEVEDMDSTQSLALTRGTKTLAKEEISRIHWDTWSGMFYSNLAAYFIILAAGVTLFVAGVTNITTAAEAALALKPLAGNFAYLLFSIGILGVGLIGVPVLAGSSAYAISETMGWKWGLEKLPQSAIGFYGVIAAGVLPALFMQYSPISPMRALFWSAVINGVVAIPMIAIIIILASKKKLMGDYVASKTILFLGGVAVIVMGLASVWMFISD